MLPAVDRDKSHAFAEWVDADRSAVSFYMGDDAHDEAVYPRVRERDGFAVAIGRFASRAEYALTDPQQVMWFLEWLEREWRAARRLDAKPNEILEPAPVARDAEVPEGPDAEIPARVSV